jgi:hypothetical protein
MKNASERASVCVRIALSSHPNQVDQEMSPYMQLKSLDRLAMWD